MGCYATLRAGIYQLSARRALMRMDLTLGLNGRTLAGLTVTHGWRTLAQGQETAKSLWSGSSRPQRRTRYIHDPDRLQQHSARPHWPASSKALRRVCASPIAWGTLTLPDVSADERSAIDHFWAAPLLGNVGRATANGTHSVRKWMCDSLAEAVQALPAR